MQEHLFLAQAVSQHIVLAKGSTGVTGFLEEPDFTQWSGTAPAFRYIIGGLSALAAILSLVYGLVNLALFPFSGSQDKRTIRFGKAKDAGAVFAIALLFYPLVLAIVKLIALIKDHIL